MKDFSDLKISQSETIINALVRMDEKKRKLLIVVDDDSKFLTLITIGDIQRAIIRKQSLESPIKEILTPKEKFYSGTEESLQEIKEKMLLTRAEFIPIVDERKELINVVFWEDCFFKDEQFLNSFINIPVVIMAGGKGTRLSPITNIIPKPLIPIENKTIIENIMDRFEKQGASNFFISVNYKSELLEYYIKSLEHKYQVEFFKEDKPLGTIGSIFLIKEKLRSPFFVTNCDIILKHNYQEILDYHMKNKNDITIISVLKNMRVPYGVIETGKNGIMKSFKEKPIISIQINTGGYILNPNVVDFIPKDVHFDITDLFNVSIQKGCRIGCFPINEDSWIDIGQWPEYLKTIKSQIGIEL